MTAPASPLQPGSSLQLAVASAGAARATLSAWALWWHEVSSTPYAVSEPAIADRKLAWWMQAVDEGFRQVPQHPLLRPLLPPGQGPASASPPPLPVWMSQLKGLQDLTAHTRWMDMAGLRRHMDATTGAACEGAAWLMGVRQDDALAAARALGAALRRVHILARLGQDTRQGWLHIPIDVLQAHGVRAHELLNPAPGDPAPPVAALLDAWAREAGVELAQALEAAAALPRRERLGLRPLVVLARLSQALLSDLREAGYPVLHQRVALGPLRKRLIAWRAHAGWR